MDVAVSLGLVASGRVSVCMCICMYVFCLQGYCKPVMVKEPVFHIKAGRHAVVEAMQKGIIVLLTKHSNITVTLLSVLLECFRDMELLG